MTLCELKLTLFILLEVRHRHTCMIGLASSSPRAQSNSLGFHLKHTHASSLKHVRYRSLYFVGHVVEHCRIAQLLPPGRKHIAACQRLRIAVVMPNVQAPEGGDEIHVPPDAKIQGRSKMRRIFLPQIASLTVPHLPWLCFDSRDVFFSGELEVVHSQILSHVSLRAAGIMRTLTKGQLHHGARSSKIRKFRMIKTSNVVGNGPSSFKNIEFQSERTPELYQKLSTSASSYAALGPSRVRSHSDYQLHFLARYKPPAEQMHDRGLHYSQSTEHAALSW